MAERIIVRAVQVRVSYRPVFKSSRDRDHGDGKGTYGTLA